MSMSATAARGVVISSVLTDRPFELVQRREEEEIGSDKLVIQKM